MSISEFELIDRFFKPPIKDDENLVLGIGDDAALLRLNNRSQLLVKSSTLVEGIDFEPDHDPSQLGRILLGKPVGQLDKQKARPAWATLSLTIPDHANDNLKGTDENWLKEFSKGLFEMASKYDLRIVGGDTSRGTTTILTIHVYATENN